MYRHAECKTCILSAFCFLGKRGALEGSTNALDHGHAATEIGSGGGTSCIPLIDLSIMIRFSSIAGVSVDFCYSLVS